MTLLSNINISGNNVINGSSTILSNLNVINNTNLQATTILSTLNVSSNTILQSNTTMLSSLYVSSTCLINNNTTILSNLNVSGNSIYNNSITCLGNLYLSSNSIINGNSTILGNSFINGNTTVVSNIYISNNSFINGNSTILGNIYISTNSIINGNLSINSNLSISGNSSINGNSIINGNTFISGNSSIIGNSIISGNSSINGNSSIIGNSLISGNSSIIGNLAITGTSIFNNNTTFVSPINILNTASFINQVSLSNLPEYQSNADASSGGIPIWGLYRTGGIIKIRLDDISPTITLLKINGNTNIVINQNTTYIEPGATVSDNTDSNLIAYICSVTSIDTGELINTPIPLTTINIPLPIINTTIPRIYTITYIVTDSSGNYTNVSRTLTIRSLIRNILFNNLNITQLNNIGGRLYTITNNNLVNGRIIAWRISDNGLSSLGFSFSSSWQIIIKGIIATNINIPYLNFSIDPTTLGENTGRYNIEFGGPNSGSSNSGWFQDANSNSTIFTTNDNLIPTLLIGFYCSIKYNINGTLNITFIDLNGNIIYSWISPITINYFNNIIPFCIYSDIDSCNFHNGILYDITTNLSATYLDFKSNFGL